LADVTDRIKALPDVTVEIQRQTNDWIVMVAKRGRGECTVNVSCETTPYVRRTYGGLQIKVNGSYNCTVRPVVWKRIKTPVDFPYDKIIQRVSDILDANNAKADRQEEERLKKDADRQEVLSLFGDLFTTEEHDDPWQMLPVTKHPDGYGIRNLPHLTAEQTRHILSIIRAKKVARSVGYEPDDLSKDEPEKCSECHYPTRYWLDPHTPLCQACAKG